MLQICCLYICALSDIHFLPYFDQPLDQYFCSFCDLSRILQVAKGKSAVPMPRKIYHHNFSHRGLYRVNIKFTLELSNRAEGNVVG